jgi:signal transduction histidine kinase
MKTNFLFLLFCLLSGHFVFGQRQEIDSLEVLLKTAKEDSIKINILTDLSWKYITTAPQKTEEYVRQGLILARRLGLLKKEVILLNFLGDCYRRQSKHVEGVEYATQSLKVATQANDSIGIAEAYRLLGLIHSFSLKQYEAALTYFLKALPIYERQNDKKGLATQLSTIAWLYVNMNKNLPLAHQYTDKALAIVTKMGDNQLISWGLNSKGLIYEKEGKLDSALLYLKKSNEYAEIAKDKAVFAYNNTIIGRIYILQDKTPEALKLYRQGIDNIHKLGAVTLLRDTYEGLARGYELLNKYDSAYKYHLLSTQIKDSLSDLESKQKITIIEAEYAKERKEATIAQLESEKRNNMIIFAVFVFALLMVIVLIIFNNRQRSKTNQLLQEKNEEIALQNEHLQQSQEEIEVQRDIVTAQNDKLQALNSTKDKLFSIIGHDLRSPIGSLKGLLTMMVKDQITTEEFNLFIPKLYRNVNSIYETLDHLLQWSYSQMDGIKTSPIFLDINAIIEGKMILFAEIAKAKQISLIQQIPPNTHIFADENQLRLVLRNLINNAIKFTAQGGSVTITALRNDNSVEISIADTGIGMPAKQVEDLFKANTHFTTQGTSGEKGTGLGLILCKEMVESNGGKIWVESEEGKGSKFTFSLPVRGDEN